MIPGMAAVTMAMKPTLPLLGTLVAYEAGVQLQRRLAGAAWSNPVLVAVIVVASVTAWCGMSPADYLEGVRPLALLLGPATIALAVPLHRNLSQIRVVLAPVVVSLVCGALIAGGTAVAVAALLRAPDVIVHSMATKTVTAAVAITVAPQIGGDPALAAGICVLTGIIGAVICMVVLDRAGVRDQRARGLATGLVAHGIGTARMLLDPVAGAFASLAMGLTGLLVGVALPICLAGWAHR